MNFPNIRDVLTSFSPALDYLALSTGDGRIKIWDTVKGQVQTEFADLATAEETNLYTKVGKGHLSVDFTCMKWLSLEKKKKRKFGTSLLILGTGSGDVLALDVAAGQLNWRISDCHPGGVSAVASSRHASCIYSSGADGMICEIDPHTGNLMRKLKASTKAISCLSVSPDGKVLATASAQLKTFNCSNHKKIQKFTGHPGGVRCMAFSEDGKYILSSATGERYIALWKTGGAKKQSASCVLAMEHPPVFLDSQCLTGEQGLHVLAISEIGVCYFWHGSNLEELSNVKPTKVSLPIEDSLLQRHKGSAPTIFAAKLQGILKPGSAHAFIAFGLLVKPSFQKMLLQFGSDLVLNASKDGVLLPIDHSGSKAKKGLGLQSKVTALDRAHAEDALLPVPIVADLEDTCVQQNLDTYMITDVANQGQAALDDGNGPLAGVEMSPETFCMEDRLKSLGILSSMDESSNLSHSSIIEGIDFEANLPEKKIRSAVLSMAPSSACKTLETLVALWQTRAGSGSHLLPWIYNILMNHSHHIISEELKNHRLLDTLLKITKSRGMALQQLLQLSGRLQLVTAQIDKTANQTPSTAHEEQMDESDADEDVEDHFYGEDDNESELSSDDEKGDTRME
ncbi:PREDICTED: WD repeat-containing protein 43 isoform X2 [Tarenaya hassleriana]|uniref:WD repeat-containing protein 43 isoform X2 n=1 Tax=Tarenaya hassleriana TaxID=28532 RepID=UPI00053C2E2F|nr:PREDICTED: WD repeat-containing protein 43 isoform X2 [Tarenaya hassleriana]